jgi:hypothetical protein
MYWDSIVQEACPPDDSTTAFALSLTSRFIHTVSEEYHVQSLCLGNITRILEFADYLDLKATPVPAPFPPSHTFHPIYFPVRSHEKRVAAREHCAEVFRCAIWLDPTREPPRAAHCKATERPDSLLVNGKLVEYQYLSAAILEPTILTKAYQIRALRLQNKLFQMLGEGIWETRSSLLLGWRGEHVHDVVEHGTSQDQRREAQVSENWVFSADQLQGSVTSEL